MGVASESVCATERAAGDAEMGSERTSTSSTSCHAASEGCSRHSYMRKQLSDEIVACGRAER